MTNDTTGGPAFPVPPTYFPNGQVQYGEVGMTLRDYFFAAALTGILANPRGPVSRSECIKQANLMATEAMKQREGK